MNKTFILNYYKNLNQLIKTEDDNWAIAHSLVLFDKENYKIINNKKFYIMLNPVLAEYENNYINIINAKHANLGNIYIIAYMNTKIKTEEIIKIIKNNFNLLNNNENKEGIKINV